MNSIGGEGDSSTHAVTARRRPRIRERHEAIAERAVADLVVRLRERDEGTRGKAATRLASRRPGAKPRSLALIGEAFGEAAAEQPQRTRCVVGVVPVAFAGDEDVQRMMDIVVPLGGREARPARGVTREAVRFVAVVLEHDVNVASPEQGVAPQGLGELGHDVRLRVVDDRVHGIETQPVDSIFVDPVKRIVDEELAHETAPLTVEIDRRSPRRSMARVEELRRVGMQVIALRAEMVVHDVEQHHEAVCVRRVDQTLQVVGRPVAVSGRERQHAVVAPIARRREIRPPA